LLCRHPGDIADILLHRGGIIRRSFKRGS
jgi:hypothetical protein